ncbi:MAG: primase C-terminal domain-containing protein, partial [Nitrospirae bacterium]|nr:primase C-terminal domain-containing protein [Nitrospirota bacterium]
IARGVLKKASVQAEIFPKQDDLPQNGLGNFIWLPLSGESVKGGRTLFVNPVSLKPYPDQWTYLASSRRLSGQDVSEILRMKGLGMEILEGKSPGKGRNGSLKIYQGDLLPCAQRMLEGVSAGCRDVATFRLAIHLKSRGYTLQQAEELLQTWNATRNRPPLEAGIITVKVHSAYSHGYTGYGCEDPLVIPFCEGSCLIKKKEFAGLMVAERGYDEKDNSEEKR